MVDLSLEILKGITPTHSHPLYKALRGIIFPFTNFQVLQRSQALQLTKLSTLLSLPNSFP